MTVGQRAAIGCLVTTGVLNNRMSLVQKVRNAISAHPRVTTTAAAFGIGLAMTVVIGSVVGGLTILHSPTSSVTVATMANALANSSFLAMPF